MEISMEVSQNLKIEKPHDPVISPGYTPKGIKVIYTIEIP
jgi:hypothetical protein